MKKFLLIFMIGLLALTQGSTQVAAQSYTPFLAVEDSLVFEQDPDINFNNVGTLAVSFSNSFGDFDAGYTSYVKFNLAGNLPSYVGPGTVVRFTMHIPPDTFPFNAALWSTADADDGWDEDTLTYTNRPLPLAKLAVAEIPLNNGEIEFSSPELTQYINTEWDGNRIASFVFIFDTCPGACAIPGNMAFFHNWEHGSDGPTLVPAAPTAVDVQQMEAQPWVNSVRLNWETVSENTLAGFQVIRSIGDDPDLATPVNPNLLDVDGGGFEGHAYSVTDAAVEPGVSYNYWLRIVYIDGRVSLQGPLSAAAEYGAFLPLMRRSP